MSFKGSQEPCMPPISPRNKMRLSYLITRAWHSSGLLLHKKRSAAVMSCCSTSVRLSISQSSPVGFKKQVSKTPWFLLQSFKIFFSKLLVCCLHIFHLGTSVRQPYRSLWHGHTTPRSKGKALHYFPNKQNVRKRCPNVHQTLGSAIVQLRPAFPIQKNDDLSTPEAWRPNCGLDTDVTTSILSSRTESKRSAMQVPVKRQGKQQVNKLLANSSGPMRSRRGQNIKGLTGEHYIVILLWWAGSTGEYIWKYTTFCLMGSYISINTPIVYCVALTAVNPPSM